MDVPLDLSLASAVTSYTTGNPATALNGSECVNAVFTRTTETNETLRINATSGGTFVLDMPSGSGGMVSFKTDKAATLTDISSRNWYGLVFSDTGSTNPISARTEVELNGAVKLFAKLNLNAAESENIVKQVNGVAPLTPANKFDAPKAYTDSGNVLLADYPAPKDIPGVFNIDNGTDGNVVVIAAKFGNQRIIYGVVYNYRWFNASNILEGCTPGTPDCLLRNTGNFILISH